LSDLALNKSLIDEYIKYKFEDNYTSSKIIKLFKYIQSFQIRTTHSDFFSDPSSAGQFVDPLINIIDSCSDEELVQNTVLKLMLVDTVTSGNYRTLNVVGTNERLKLNYSARYENSMGKDKAQEHIKDLLSDSSYVRIIDSYIAKDDNQWTENKNIIANIVPKTSIDLTIENGSQYTNTRGIRITSEAKINDIKKGELETICSNWNVIPRQLNTDQVHDRYIETNKLRILLSSGLFNLSSSSRKDFTYVVEIR
jgi:hypothetical protein